MAEYINKEAVLYRLESLMKRITPIEESRDMFYHDSGINGAITGAMIEVENTPAADVVEVKHGKWIEKENNYDTYYDCSVCGDSFVFIEGGPIDNLYYYCPNCGAKMGGENNV